MEELDRSTVAGQVRYLAHNPHYFTYVSGREYSEEEITAYVKRLSTYLSAGGVRVQAKRTISKQVLEQASKRREDRVARNTRMAQRRSMHEELVMLQRSINSLW